MKKKIQSALVDWKLYQNANPKEWFMSNYLEWKLKARNRYLLQKIYRTVIAKYRIGRQKIIFSSIMVVKNR